MGKPGFPIPPPGGRVWEGYALARIMFILSVCGGAAWTAERVLPLAAPAAGGGRGPIASTPRPYGAYRAW